MTVHNMKVPPAIFEKIERNKPFEINLSGSFQVGDLIGLLAFDPEKGYTGLAAALVVVDLPDAEREPMKKRVFVRSVDFFDDKPEQVFKFC